MNNFLTDLYNYISEHTPSMQDDQEYQRAVQEYMKLEEEVKEKTGSDLLMRYRRAEDDISRQENVAVLAQTLRLVAFLALNVLR